MCSWVSQGGKKMKADITFERKSRRETKRTAAVADAAAAATEAAAAAVISSQTILKFCEGTISQAREACFSTASVLGPLGRSNSPSRLRQVPFISLAWRIS